MMTVGELKKILENYEETMPVFLSSDEEGNDFLPVEEVAMLEVGEWDETFDEKIISDNFENTSLNVNDQVLMIWP